MDDIDEGVKETLVIDGNEVEIAWYLKIGRSLADPYMGIATVSWKLKSRIPAGSFFIIADYSDVDDNDVPFVKENAPLSHELTDDERDAMRRFLVRDVKKFIKKTSENVSV